MSSREKIYTRKFCSKSKDQLHPRFSKLNKNPKTLPNACVCSNLLVRCWWRSSWERQETTVHVAWLRDHATLRPGSDKKQGAGLSRSSWPDLARKQHWRPLTVIVGQAGPRPHHLQPVQLKWEGRVGETRARRQQQVVGWRRALAVQWRCQHKPTVWGDRSKKTPQQKRRQYQNYPTKILDSQANHTNGSPIIPWNASLANQPYLASLALR